MNIDTSIITAANTADYLAKFNTENFGTKFDNIYICKYRATSDQYPDNSLQQMIISAPSFNLAKAHLFWAICHSGEWCITWYEITETRVHQHVNIADVKREAEKYLDSQVMCVECINATGYSKVVVGEKYYVKKDSIYFDEDGDCFGFVYEDKNMSNSKWIGNLKLNRFKTLY